MVKIKGNNITLTRGDTLRLKLNLFTSSGEVYEPDPNDVIRFGMKRCYKDEEFLLTKVIPNDSLTLHLEPKDTKNLPWGIYVWDCQIEFSNGDVYTFISKASMEITEEVV